MAFVSPADLSLELAVPQKRIRDFLRDRYGVLSGGVTRWELDDVQAAVVRARFAGTFKGPRSWTLEPGDTVRRRAIHQAYGGQQQGGISTPRDTNEILIFTNLAQGAQFGYDRFEGLREDGSYAYTGEGQYGKQEFVRGNRALRNSAADGKTIRLLRTQGVMATYVGEFTTGEPTFTIETIPDADGHPREGIIFNLVPISAAVELLPQYGGVSQAEGTSARGLPVEEPWTPPEYSDVVTAMVEPGPIGDRVVSRVEFELQSAFGAWLLAAGAAPSRLRLPTGASMIEPDFFVADRGWIVEAKKSSARTYVRTAIGQVLDYVHVASKNNIDARPIILLPGAPEPDLIELIHRHGIGLIVKTIDGFEELSGDLPEQRRQ